MVLGFFLSRALLSSSMMLFGINALMGISPKKWFSNRWWLLGFLWVGGYLLSYFWSNNYPYWYTRCEVKLPILLLPLAFSFTPAFNYKQLKTLTILLAVSMLMSVAYSCYYLFSNPAFYINGYNYSHVLPTIPDDHISVSAAYAATVVWSVFFYKYIKESWLKIFIVIVVVILSIALHGLAARTGLLALYIFGVGYFFYLIFKKKTRFIGLTFLLAFFITGYCAFKYLPTLKERMNHVDYTIYMYKHGTRSGDYSDIGRYMSYNIALKLIASHPLKGVSAGNILDTMKAGYDKWYPQVPDEQRLIPHNQLLIVGVACGIPAMLVFLLWLLYPITQIKKNRSGFFFFIMWCVLLVPLSVDPTLEIQYGVFVYLFFLLLQYHTMQKGIEQ